MSNQFPPSGLCMKQLEWHFYHASLIHFGINIIKKWGPRHLAGTVFCNTPGMLGGGAWWNPGGRGLRCAVLLWTTTLGTVLWTDDLNSASHPQPLPSWEQSSFLLGKGTQIHKAPLLATARSSRVRAILQKHQSYLNPLLKPPKTPHLISSKMQTPYPNHDLPPAYPSSSSHLAVSSCATFSHSSLLSVTHMHLSSVYCSSLCLIFFLVLLVSALQRGSP